MADVIEITRALRETRMKLALELRNHVDDCHRAHPGEPMTAEERAKDQAINARIDEIEAEVRAIQAREERLADLSTAAEYTERHIGPANAAARDRQDRAAFAEWLRDKSPMRTKEFTFNTVAAAHEANLIRAGASFDEVRALAWDTGSIASGVPTTTARELYALVTAPIAMLNIGARRIQTGSGEQMKFPRVNAHAIATQVSGQGTTLAGTDPTFLSMTLDAYKYGELVIVSNEILQDTVFDVVSFVNDDVARALSQKIDTDLTVGTGSGQPQGIMGAITGAGTIATGGSLINPTYENLVDLVYSVNANYRSDPSTAFLMRDLTVGALRKIRSDAGGTTGPTMWVPSVMEGIRGQEPDRLLGYRVFSDPNVASLASNAVVMAFGAFNRYYFREVGNISIERDDSRYFDTDQVGFRGKWRVDGDVIDTTAFNILKRSV